MLTNRKKLLLAGAGSALLHALLLLGAAVIVARQPVDPPTPRPEPIHLEIVQSPPALPDPDVPAPEHRVVDTAGMESAEHPPADAKFEGDRDTKAGSEEPPTGDQPLPTQKGRAAPEYVFDTAPPPPPVAPLAADQPPATPPSPATRAQLHDDSEDPGLTLAHNDLTMVDAEPAPVQAAEANPYDPSFRSTAPPPPVPMKQTAEGSAYRPIAERTATSGNIAAPGASGVDAAATPYGRYRKAILDSIRAVWTQQVQAHPDATTLGKVRFHFSVDREGHVHSPALLTEPANDVLASITLEAISKASIPPFPPEIADTLKSTMLQLDVTFECL